MEGEELIYYQPDIRAYGVGLLLPVGYLFLTNAALIFASNNPRLASSRPNSFEIHFKIPYVPFSFFPIPPFFLFFLFPLSLPFSLPSHPFYFLPSFHSLLLLPSLNITPFLPLLPFIVFPSFQYSTRSPSFFLLFIPFPTSNVFRCFPFTPPSFSLYYRSPFSL